MFTGLLFTFLTGCSWGLACILCSKASHAKAHVPHFYIIGSLTSLVLLGLLNCIFGVTLFAGVPHWWTATVAVLAGSLGCVTNLLTMYILGFNGAAMYMALAQLGFAFSFLFNVAFFGGKMSLVNAVGLICLVAAIFLSQGAGATAKKERNLRLLGVSLLASLTSGCMQVFNIIPLKYPMPTLGRTTIVLFTYLTVWCIVLLAKRQFDWPRSPRLYGIIAGWGIIAVAAYFCLFTSVQALIPFSRAGIVCPTGMTLQILIFILYTRIILKEKLTPAQMGAMAFIIVGMFAICL